MALQIRRGTEAQRQALAGVDVPALGELLYTTNTKKLYIGDGVTDGGLEAGYFASIEVAGEDTLVSTGNNSALTFVAGAGVSLTTDNNTNTLTINGYDGSSAISTLLVGEAYSSTPVDSFVEIEGSGSRLMRFGVNMSTYGTDSNATIEFASYRATPANNDEGPQLVFRQSTDTSYDEVMATIHSVATNVGIGTVASKLVFSLYGSPEVVTINSNGIVGDLTGDVTGDVTGNVYAIDTTLLVDAATGILTGDLIGHVTGDVKGSVFADDSTILVDSVSGVLRGELIGTLTGDVNGNLSTSQLTVSTNTISTITDGTTMVLTALTNGYIRVESPMRVSRLIASINGGDVGVFIINSDSTNAPMVTVSAFDGVGAGAPLTLGLENDPITGSTVNYARARGNLASLASLQANDYIAVTDFAGYDGASFVSSAQIRSIVSDSPTTGAVPGGFEFAVADSTGNMGVALYISPTSIDAVKPIGLVTLTDTQRDALTPVFGSVIYNSTTNKFQGYQNTGGTTPEWVDLS